MRRLAKSIGYALTGLKIAFQQGRNLKILSIFGLLAIFLSLTLRIPTAHFLIIILTIAFVLAIEILNSALEEVCNKFHPSHDPHIGKIKDLAAGAVLIAITGAGAIGAVIFLPYII